MSIAGPYLFTTDDQRDIVLYITSEARKLTGFPITLWYPEAKAPVLWIMNGGLYHELLQVFWRRKSHRDMLFLTALSMQLGVTIPLADLETMRQHLERMPLKNIVFQMRVGLGGYRNNGEEWDFRSPTTFGILERNTSVHRQTGGKGSPVSGQRGGEEAPVYEQTGDNVADDMQRPRPMATLAPSALDHVVWQNLPRAGPSAVPNSELSHDSSQQILPSCEDDGSQQFGSFTQYLQSAQPPNGIGFNNLYES